MKRKENEKMGAGTDWEQMEESFNKLRTVTEQAKREYELINYANKFGLSLENYRQIFEASCHKEKINGLIVRFPPLKLFGVLERGIEEVEYWTKRMELFALLQRVSSLSILIGVIVFVINIPEQTKQRELESERKNIERQRAHYEAWAIINNNKVDNSGKFIKSSSGRVTALENLNRDGVPLQGLDVENAFLFNINLQGADLYRANFRGADLYKANFNSIYGKNYSKEALWWLNPCSFSNHLWIVQCPKREDQLVKQTTLERAKLQGTTLYDAKFYDVNLFRANLSDSRAINADFTKASLESADLTRASLLGAKFREANLKCANLEGAVLYDADYSQRYGVADFRGAKNLTPEQVIATKGWEQAKFDDDFKRQLKPTLSKRNQSAKCPHFPRDSE